VDGSNQVESWYNRNANWINGLATAMIVQAIIAIIAIEFAFSRVKRMQAVDETRDSKFPAWRRRDAKNWSRLKFYPLGLLTMPFRLVFIHV
jgi:hypothetical protein